MKTFFRNIHLYLSLAAGLVIVFSAVTGAIMVFEDEIERVIDHDRFYVQPEGRMLPLSMLTDAAIAAVPKSKLSSVKVNTEEGRTVEIALSVPEKKPEAEGPVKGNRSGEAGKPGGEKGKGGGKPSVIVYMNPYTGEVTEIFNRRESFFMKVEMLHRFILGGQGGIGKWITGISTLFFFFILLTGIILWWPRTKQILYQRLKIKTDGSFKRLNHDLHIVTGFYTSIFLIVIVMTGLIMAFNWINRGIFTLTNSSPESPGAPSSVYVPASKPVSIDEIYLNIKKEVSSAEYYTIRLPRDSAGTFIASVLPLNLSENRSDQYYFDQYTGKLTGKYAFADKNAGQKIRSFVKPLHTGELFGLTSKIINFILCLLTISFPVTGVIMWLNRLKKKEKKRKTTLTTAA